MATLVPSILETTKQQFLDTYAREVKLPGVTRIQVDFGDGVFVPNTILPISEIDVLNPAIHFEAHLMIQEPKDFLDYQICGFKTIIIHYEAFSLPTKVRLTLQQIAQMGLEPGLCIKPETDVAALKEFEDVCKHFQLMSVHPGFQGTEFLLETYERIAKLRNLCPNAIIEVDGGINETNIKKVADAGADLIVVGSAVTKAAEMGEAWEKLQASLTIA